jgi:ribosomal RNA methyltransferase Nop2
MFNVDGFYVAKFKKTDVTPAALVGNPGARVGDQANGAAEDEDEDATIISEGGDQDEDDVEAPAFENFDDDEDEKLIERSLRRNLRRKGIDPKATKSAAVKSYSKSK